MKRLYALLAALLLVAFALPAEAAWNIRQKGTGGAVWTDQNSIDVPIGSAGMIVHITSLATLATTYVTTNKPGKLRRIYVVGHTFVAESSRPGFTFQIAAPLTNYFIAISAGAVLSMTTATGVPASLTPSDVNIDVQQGGTIAIYNRGTGSSSGNVNNQGKEGMMTIVIE
jgi:hypothetical protein